MCYSGKHKSYIRIIFAVLAMLVANLACGTSTPEAKPAATVLEKEAVGLSTLSAGYEVEEDAPTEQSPPTATPKPLGSARSNPAPPGHEVTLGDLTIVVGEVIRPATEIVMNGNMFNTEPEQGQEYIFIGVSTRCDKESDDTCNIIGFEFSLIGSSGVARDPELFVAGVDGIYEGGEFYGGATLTGYLPFIVGQEETDLILKYEELFGGEAYMAVGQ